MVCAAMIAINDKVVCVNDAPGRGTLKGQFDYPSGFVQKGKVYVVEGFKMLDFDDDPKITVGLKLTGLPVFDTIDSEEWAWQVWRFRKLEHLQEINRLKAQIGEPQEAFL